MRLSFGLGLARLRKRLTGGAGGATAPFAFSSNMWSVADAGTDGDVTFTIAVLPANNGSVITDLQYRVGAGAWTTFGSTATGNYTIAGFTNNLATSVTVRAVNAIGNGPESDTKSVTATVPVFAPSAFTVGQWTVVDTDKGQQATFDITALPSDGGSPITALQYKIGAGVWTDFVGTGTGTRIISGFTDGASTATLIRAVNAIGAGSDSDTKNVTATAGVPSAFGTSDWSVVDSGTNGDAVLTIINLPADNGSALIAVKYNPNGTGDVTLTAPFARAHSISGLTDGISNSFRVRAQNSVGNGTLSGFKNINITGVPAAFTIGMWSVADAATSGDATVTISSLPVTNGSAITALQYSIAGGTWTAFSAATTGSYTIPGFVDDVSNDIVIRAVNANGNAPDSDIKYVTTTATPGVPAAFIASQWTVVDDATSGDATISITALPSAGGSAITALEYSINGGTWTALSGTGTGARSLSGFNNGIPTSVELRAVNAIGNGPSSDVKSVATTGLPAAFTAGQWSIVDLNTSGDARVSITALAVDNGAAPTDMQYKIGAGAWTSFGATVTGDYDIAGFTDTVSTAVLIRIVNAVGNGPDSDSKNVTTTASAAVPAAMTVGQWSIAASGITGSATISILTLPNDGGSALIALEYKIGAGAWTELPTGTTASPGNYTINGFTDGVSTAVLVRATNAQGNGTDSDSKNVTTTAGGVTVSAQSAPFGALTLSGAGGFRPFDSTGAPVDLIAVTDMGTGTRTWSISNGTLVANGTPAVDNGRVIVCSHAGGSVTLTIASVANEYSVRTAGQVVTLSTTASTAGGFTVRFRNETLTSGNAGNRMFKNKTYTSEVVLTGGANTIIKPQLAVENGKNVRISGLTVINDNAADFGLSCVQLHGACNIIVEDMVIRGVERNPLADYSTLNSYTNPLTGIVSVVATSGNPIDVTIRRCDVRHVKTGISITNTGILNYTDNVVLYTYSDCMKHGPTGGGLTSIKTIARNVLGLMVGLPEDANNPHTDCFQIGGSSGNHLQAVTNYIFEQNIMFTDTAITRGDYFHGIASFTDGGFSPTITGAIVRGNLVRGVRAPHTIAFETADGGEVYSNTIIGGSGRMQFNCGARTQTKLRGNLTELATIGTTATNTDALVIGAGGATHAYTSVFNAYTANPGESLAGILAAYTMKPNGPADRDNSGTGTLGDAGAIGTGMATFGSALNPSGWTVNSSYAPA